MAGCEFAATAPPSTGDDGQGQGQGQGGVDAGTSATAPCDVTDDSSLQLCLTFDHNPMVQDLSGYAHTVTDAINVAPIVRSSGSTAAVLTAASRVHIADDDKFDVAQLTIDMWIAPAPGATTQHSWLLDNNTQYFLTYEMDGKIRCGIGSKVVTSSATIPSTGWHHVACTYGTNHELRVYVDGDRSGCLDGSSSIPTTGTDGIAIGANYGNGGTYAESYAGGIDAVHVYGRALSDAQVCIVAGQSSCRVTNCNQGGPGPD
jgi:hypothetical protein